MSPLRAHSVYRNLNNFGRPNLLSSSDTLLLWYKALGVVESAKKEPVNYHQLGCNTLLEQLVMQHYHTFGNGQELAKASSWSRYPAQSHREKNFYCAPTRFFCYH
jgi:hypothetical protein